MSILKNFPMVSQLTQVTSDGKPSENAQFDCVPASIAAGILWYEGKSQWDASINPDLLKDQAYGENWKNEGTAAARYVPVVAKMGYKLSPINDIPGALVTETHKQLQAGHPVIFTEPDPYVSASLGWTHVCVFFGEETGYLTALDPYIAKAIRRTDHEWRELLQYKQIWILEKLPNGGEEDLSIDINTPGVADQFIELDTSHWRSKKTGKIIQYGMLAEFKRIGYQAGWGHPLSNEVYYASGKSKQNFECAVPGYDKATGKVELLPLYEPGSAGVDPAIADLEKQLAEARAAPTLVQNAQAITVVQQVKKLVEPF